MVAYSRAEQARMVEEITALPENAVIIGWLANYAVLRAQVRVCQDN